VPEKAGADSMTMQKGTARVGLDYMELLWESGGASVSACEMYPDAAVRMMRYMSFG